MNLGGWRTGCGLTVKAGRVLKTGALRKRTLHVSREIRRIFQPSRKVWTPKRAGATIMRHENTP